MAQSGRVVFLEVNLGTQASPIWDALAKQQSLDITRGANTQSVSHKDSSNEVIISSTLSKSFSVGGVMFRSQAALQRTKTAFDTKTDLHIRISENGQVFEEEFVKVTQFDEAHPVDGVSTYSITMQPAE